MAATSAASNSDTMFASDKFGANSFRLEKKLRYATADFEAIHDKHTGTRNNWKEQRDILYNVQSNEVQQLARRKRTFR